MYFPTAYAACRKTVLFCKQYLQNRSVSGILMIYNKKFMCNKYLIDKNTPFLYTETAGSAADNQEVKGTIP